MNCVNAPVKILSFALLLALCLCAALPSHALWGVKGKAAAQAGALLFRDRGCVRCHGEAGVGGKKGPALTNLRQQKQWTPAKITAQIQNGGQRMPPFGEALSSEEIAQLVAYLRARHRPVAPPAPSQ
jgi:mono/diheme cytochrome c family protein